jgi:hypothetical protein
MSPDRELLKDAAKAAGIKWQSYHMSRGLCLADPKGGMVITQMWNPLTDDGDNATLEAKLFLDVSWFKNSVKINAMPSWLEWGISITEEFPVFSSTEEKKKAKRRAITRAAAQIGKVKP